MGVFNRIRSLLSGGSRATDEELQAALSGFDDYCQKLIVAVDQQWDSSARVRSVEYCVFLHGAALAIVRGYGREDAHTVAILGSYLSRFMDWQLSVKWLLECEAELAKSARLQGIHAAGGNTAQAVILAGSQGRSEELNRIQNTQVLIQIFSEIRKLMDHKDVTDDALFMASEQLYDSILKK